MARRIRHGSVGGLGRTKRKIKGKSGPGSSEALSAIGTTAVPNRGSKVGTERAGAACGRETVNICGLCLGAKHYGGKVRVRARKNPLRGAEDEMQVPVALRLSLDGRARVREQGSPIALGGALMTLLDDPG
jgi:hypothetical protein